MLCSGSMTSQFCFPVSIAAHAHRVISCSWGGRWVIGEARVCGQGCLGDRGEATRDLRTDKEEVEDGGARDGGPAGAQAC